MWAGGMGTEVRSRETYHISQLDGDPDTPIRLEGRIKCLELYQLKSYSDSKPISILEPALRARARLEAGLTSLHLASISLELLPSKNPVTLKKPLLSALTHLVLVSIFEIILPTRPSATCGLRSARCSRVHLHHRYVM